MKERTLKLACVSVLACIIGLALSGAAVDAQGTEVENLLKKRVDIMENTLSGNISFSECRNQLRTVEQDKLLSDDLESIKSYQNSDYDKVIDMKILSIEEKSHVSDLMTYESEIHWTYQGVYSPYSQTRQYYIGVIEDDDELRLVSFELL